MSLASAARRLARWLLLSMLLCAAPARALEPAGGPAGLEEDEAEAADASVAERGWLLDTEAHAEPAPRVSGTPSLGLALVGLVLIGLGGAALWLRQRRTKLSPMPEAEARLRVLASSRVGPKAYAVSASAGGRMMLLGVTDHSVTHLCWLDTPAPASEAPPIPEAKDDDLPDDYPGSALRHSARVSANASSAEPHWAMSEGSLQRFQEVLRDAALEPNHTSARYQTSLSDAAAILAEQTRDILSSVPPAPEKPRSAPVRRKRARKSVAPQKAAPPEDSDLEGQVAGLKALRKS